MNMKNKRYQFKKSRMRFVMYLLSSWIPVSRRKYNKRYSEMVEILNAHRELMMITRQDILLLANKMIKFHGAELKNEKSMKNVNMAAPIKKESEKNEYMYG